MLGGRAVVSHLEEHTSQHFREGTVSAVFSIEASRLARRHTLLEFCSVVGSLLIDADGVYDPNEINDRLLFGMEGTISETELASFRHHV